MSRLRSFHRRLLESFFAEGEPVPFAYTEHIDLLSGQKNPAGYVDASPEPYLYTNATAFGQYIFSLLPPPTPAGYVARLVDFSVQCGGPDTGGAGGTADVYWMICAMTAPNGVAPADPAQEILSSYSLSLVATAPPPAPSLDVLTDYASVDFTHQSDQVLPVDINPDRGMALYIQVDNQWAAPIWIWKLTLSWNFVAVP